MYISHNGNTETTAKHIVISTNFLENAIKKLEAEIQHCYERHESNLHKKIHPGSENQARKWNPGRTETFKQIHDRPFQNLRALKSTERRLGTK